MKIAAKPPSSAGRSLPLRLTRCQIVRGYLAGMPQTSVILTLDISEKISRRGALHELPDVRQRLAPLSLDRRGIRLASSIVKTSASKSVCDAIEQFSHILVSVQESAGFTVFARPLITRLSRPRQGKGNAWTVNLICPSPHPALLARFAPELARILGLWFAGMPFRTLPDALEKVIVELAKYAPAGQNMRLLLDAAHRLDVPVRPISGRTVQFGWGARARWMDSTITDRTSAISTSIARDKRVANRFLAARGVPVARQIDAPSLDAALAAAKSMGFPVVVKPANLDGGVAVTAGIQNEATLRRAYELARTHSAQVVVESHVPGQDFRLGVIHGELAWATSREPAGVWGDGVSTLQQLIESANQDARRGTRAWSLMSPLSINDEAKELLSGQGIQLADVPEKGVFVRLRSAANISSGGRPQNVHPLVHPDNEELAVRVARLARLDFAGIDFITPDISRSWREIGGAICEVNAQPQFSVEALSAPFKAITGLFEGDGRIPVTVILGDEQIVSVEALLEAFRAKGLKLGVATTKNAVVDGSPILVGSSFDAVQLLLADPDVDAIVAIVDDESWLATGAPTDRIDLLLCGEHASARMRRLLAPMCTIATRELTMGQLIPATEASALAQEAADLQVWHRARPAQADRIVSASQSASPYCRTAPPTPGTIGLCMIAKDEAQIIGNSLDSVLGLVDFVLVQDTGSSDGTPAVVRRWLSDNGVPGEVIEAPWRDFASNRTSALAQLRAHHDIDYALVLDADDLLVRDEGFDVERFKAGLKADVYDLPIHYEQLRFPRPHLLRNAKAFGFRGVLHEFVEVPPDSVGREVAKGLHIQAFSRGARSRNPRKYLDDIATLKAALRVEREPRLRSRYLFYLAQSYLDARNYRKALDRFLERVDVDFWPEEQFVAAYRAAKLKERLAYPANEVETAYRRAIEIMPDRREPYHALSRFFRLRKDYGAGFEVGSDGLRKAPRSGLFIESWIYEYGLPEETAMNAYLSGRVHECATLCNEIMAKADIPERTMARIRRLVARASERSATENQQAGYAL